MGMNPCEFWELTSAEFCEMADGHFRRKSERLDEHIYLAWHIARFVWAKELPELDVILADKSKAESKPIRLSKGQTSDQMLVMGKLLTAMYGGTIIEN